MIGRTIDMIKAGDAAELSKTISESDVYLFAGITGDLNPAHINDVYAAGTFFRARIAHGMLIGGLISAVIGMKLPGPGTIYIRQELLFQAPVFIGDTVTARVEVKEVVKEKNRLIAATTCINQHGKTVLNGEATLSPPVKR